MYPGHIKLDYVYICNPLCTSNCGCRSWETTLKEIDHPRQQRNLDVMWEISSHISAKMKILTAASTSGRQEPGTRGGAHFSWKVVSNNDFKTPALPILKSTIYCGISCWSTAYQQDSCTSQYNASTPACSETPELEGHEVWNLLQNVFILQELDYLYRAWGSRCLKYPFRLQGHFFLTPPRSHSLQQVTF